MNSENALLNLPPCVCKMKPIYNEPHCYCRMIKLKVPFSEERKAADKLLANGLVPFGNL